MDRFASGSLNDAGDGAHDAFELRYFNTELPFPIGGEGVIAGAAIAGGDTPLRADPSFDQHSLQCWVKRTLLNLENFFRATLDIFGYFIAVEPVPNRKAF